MRETSIVAAIVLFAYSSQPIQGEIVYRDLGQVLIKGSWQQIAPGNFRIINDYLQVPFFAETATLNLTHTYIPLPQAISPPDTLLVQTARKGTAAIEVHLRELSQMIPTHNHDDLTDPELANLQTEINDRLDLIDQIAHSTSFASHRLLDGSSGVSSWTASLGFTPVKTGQHAIAGVYPVEVSVPGERAVLYSPVTQQSSLSSDEILTLNGVAIELRAGMTQRTVASRIREFSAQTGVYADVAPSGETRLYSLRFGSDAMVNIVSSTAAATNSSGFGTTSLRDSGVDTIAWVDGEPYVAAGDYLAANIGAARGLHLRFHPNSGHLTTHSGYVGDVTVVDDSLIFDLHPNAATQVSLGLPSLNTPRLGVGSSQDQFYNLAQIDVFTENSAFNANVVAEHAEAEIESLLGELDQFLDERAYPDGAAYIEASNVRIMMPHGNFRLLEEGELIGGHADWSDLELLPVAELISFFNDDSDFLGLEIAQGDNLHFGWLGLEIDEEQGLIVRDVGFESTPHTSIAAGSVPEPQASTSVCLLMLVVLAARTRMSRQVNCQRGR